MKKGQEKKRFSMRVPLKTNLKQTKQKDNSSPHLSISKQHVSKRFSIGNNFILQNFVDSLPTSKGRKKNSKRHSNTKNLQDKEKTEKGIKKLCLVFKSIKEKRNALLINNIRDFIFQRIKISAFLFFISDFVELKQKRAIVYSFKTLFHESVFHFGEYKQGSIADYISEQTPQFFISRDELKDEQKSYKIEEPSYELEDFFLKKKKQLFFDALKNLKAKEKRRNRFNGNRKITKQFSMPAGQIFRDRFKVVSSSLENVKVENMRFLLKLIIINVGNRKLKYSQIFYSNLRHLVSKKKQIPKEQKPSPITKFKKIGFIFLRKKFNESKKTAFDKILSEAQKRKKKKTSVVYGKIKPIRRSITPNKNGDSFYIIRKSVNKKKSGLIRSSFKDFS